ncbi:MAG: hypothetical protein OEZ01_15570 [Candidatus Heimdallarchaeota archaeon]|nr:hypothetical protein [Candidatus Heimdallarchaeota archaeon]MDH5647428.1 hypothetical protein [Candidatus Heimdallarchaeota archaeon]
MEDVGKSYGFVIQHKDDKIYERYTPGFESEVMMFEGFLTSALKLADDYTDKGFKYLDFGLINFCIGKTEEVITFIFINNPQTSKKEGYKALEILIEKFNELFKEQLGSGSINKSSFSNGIDKLDHVLDEFNQRLVEIHTIRDTLLDLMKKRKISEEYINLDKVDLGIKLNLNNLLGLDEKQKKERLEQILDSLKSN